MYAKRYKNWKEVCGGRWWCGDRCVKERSTLKCDAPDRGDETRVAHACTFPVEAGLGPGAAWSCLEGEDMAGRVIGRWPKRPELLIARNFEEPPRRSPAALLPRLFAPYCLALRAYLDCKCLRH